MIELPAITLWAPWGSLIAALFKQIETRTHDRFRSLVGQRIAIHQGLKLDSLGHVCYELATLGRDDALAWLPTRLRSLPRGAVVATAYVAAHRELHVWDCWHACCNCIGLYGLFLKHVKPLETPIAMPGHQGIWRCHLPESAVAA